MSKVRAFERAIIILFFIFGLLGVFILKDFASACRFILRWIVSIQITVNLVDLWLDEKSKTTRNKMLTYLFLLIFNFDYWGFGILQVFLK